MGTEDGDLKGEQKVDEVRVRPPVSSVRFGICK